jgi:predicted SnoaL-like aldol condensation-catalyzing enzyme
MMRLSQVSATFSIPVYPFMFLVSIGSVAMVLEEMNLGNKEIVACHFLRVWDGEIVEHWDIHTQVPPSEEFQL